MFTFSAPSIRRSLTGSLVLAMITSVAACHSSDVSAPLSVATALTIMTGADAQVATVGQATANTASVVVVDQNDTPLAGATVVWSIMSGGGTVSTAQSTTDASGVASTTWTLGTIAGANTVQATLASGIYVTLSATGVAGPPASISIVSGNNQTVAEDSTTAPFVVSVADQYGNMINGASISWTTSAGTLGADADATDATGEATDVLTTDGTTPSYVVTATLGNLAAVFNVVAN